MQFNLIKKLKDLNKTVNQKVYKDKGWNFVEEGSLPDSDRFVQVITKSPDHSCFSMKKFEVRLSTARFTIL